MLRDDACSTVQSAGVALHAAQSGVVDGALSAFEATGIEVFNWRPRVSEESVECLLPKRKPLADFGLERTDGISDIT